MCDCTDTGSSATESLIAVDAEDIMVPITSLSFSFDNILHFYRISNIDSSTFWVVT